MNPDKTFTTKLGTTRAGERSRIWIEGARLIAHGFKPGDRFHKVWRDHETPGALVLTVISEALADELGASNCGRVSGKGTKPIIDITGERVRATFGHATHATVTYRAGRITIKALAS